MEEFMNIFLVGMVTAIFPALAMRSFKSTLTSGECMGLLLGTILALGALSSLVYVPNQYRWAELMFAVPGLVLAFWAYVRPLK